MDPLISQASMPRAYHAKLGDQLAVEGLGGCLEQIMMLVRLVVGAEQVQLGIHR
jgi:hypothetical protein